MARIPGKRGGSEAKATGFRSWCRDLALSKKVQDVVRRECETNPEFALKVAEHGFGRPPQSLDIQVATQREVRYIWPTADTSRLRDKADSPALLPDPGSTQ